MRSDWKRHASVCIFALLLSLASVPVFAQSDNEDGSEDWEDAWSDLKAWAESATTEETSKPAEPETEATPDKVTPTYARQYRQKTQVQTAKPVRKSAYTPYSGYKPTPTATTATLGRKAAINTGVTSSRKRVQASEPEEETAPKRTSSWDESRNWSLPPPGQLDREKEEVMPAAKREIAQTAAPKAKEKEFSAPVKKKAGIKPAVQEPAPLKTKRRRRKSKKEVPQQPVNLFAENFMMNPDLKLQYGVQELGGMLVIDQGLVDGKPRYAAVTDFGGKVVKFRPLPEIESLRDIRKWIDDKVETAEFQGVEIRRLGIANSKSETDYLYWVGHKTFKTAEDAKAEIALVQSIAEAEGKDFGSMVKEAQKYLFIAEQSEPIEIKSPSQQAKEEEVFLKMMDHLDIGNQLYGPFHGVPVGEPIVWQSFGESTFRTTNLAKENFNQQVGFWTNRLLFKGIRAPLNTVDPFVESTISYQTDGIDFATNVIFSAGLEWRPFERNTFAQNFQPWGLPLLDWVRSWRLFIAYGDRKNIKDEIALSRNYDLSFGASIFKEVGIDLPPVTEGRPTTVPEYLRRYVWLEYFGDYRFRTTAFTIEDDFDSWVLTSSIIIGFHTPGIPLPNNPLNSHFSLMPYMRFEHATITEHSFDFANRYAVIGGIRWMPFRDYRWKENEWLSKTKLFIEYVGLGKVQHTRQDGEASNAIRDDLRFGISISSRRF